MGNPAGNFYDKIISVAKPTAVVYDDLVSNEYNILDKLEKWQETLEKEISLTDFNMLFRNIYCVTNVAKLRSFQYRILMHALILNKQLFIYKIRDNNKCTFCNVELETACHFFWKCKICSEFWRKTRALILEMVDNLPAHEMEFNKENMLFNMVHKKPANIVNFIVLKAKYYLYVTRCKNKKPSIVQFKENLLLIRNIEKYIAIKNNRLAKHEQKWNNIALQENQGYNGNDFVNDYLASIT